MGYYAGHEFGKLVRERRLSLGISQKQLAEGICSQAELSRIERERGKWSQLMKLGLAERLGIDLQAIMQERNDYVREVVRQVNYYKRHKNYEGLYEVVKSEMKTPLARQNLFLKQLLTWHKGICMFKIQENVPDALEKLHEALNLTNVSNRYFSNIECDILNSIALVYFDSNQFEKALSPIEKAFTSFHQTPHFHDIKIISKLYYTLARTHTKLKNYLSSIQLCKQALAACREKDSAYLYSELLYQIGYNYTLLEKPKDGLKYFKKAKCNMIHWEDFRYLSIINHHIEKLKQKHNPE